MGFGDGVMMPSINAIEMDFFLDTWEEKNCCVEHISIWLFVQQIDLAKNKHFDG